MKSFTATRPGRCLVRALTTAVVWGSVSVAFCEKQKLDPADVLATHRIATNSAGLVAGLRHSNLLVRVSAAQVAGQHRDQATSAALVTTLGDEGALVRFAAAEALLKLGSREGLPVLKQLMAGPDREVGAYAAAALCNDGEAPGCTALSQFLGDSEWLIRKVAVLAVAGSTNAALNRPLLLTQAASDGNEKVRLAALQALADDGDKATVPLLIGRLRDPDQVVRYGAHKWLRELTGQSFGFQSAFPETAREEAVKRWERWWENNHEGFIVKKRAKEGL